MKIIKCKSHIEVVVFELDDVPGLTHGYMKEYNALLREKFDYLYGTMRERKCLVCGEVFAEFDLHHAIVTRRDVQGWKPEKKRRLIDIELNLIPLHNWCHLQRPPSKQKCWDVQCNFYGEKAMRDWYYSLPFKVIPRRF